MGFAQESGYVPADIATIMLDLMENINEQFSTSYTAETFLGTNFYKYFYALAQKLQENEVKTSEIFAKLQQYFVITNERISRPVTTSPGLVETLAAAGYTASVKPMEDADAGKINICVDTDDGADDYDEVKLAICTLIKESTVAGAVTQGDQTETLVLSNGQSFDFKFYLPDYVEPKLKLTTVLSENNESVILSPEDQKALLLSNIAARYKLGKNFEPQRYFSLLDAPWAASVHLQYSLDGGSTWLDAIVEHDFDEVYVLLLSNVTLVES